MKLDELLSAIDSSASDDWVVLTPVSEEGLRVRGEGSPIELRQHSHKAVFTRDLGIEIAWGVFEFSEEKLRGFWASWSNFPDRDVYSFFAEILWNGRVVVRRKLVTTDAGRVVLPAPLPIIEPGIGSAPSGWTVRRSELHLAKLITAFHGLSEVPYDVDLQTAQFRILEE